jgi:two-component sensor histidine kinase
MNLRLILFFVITGLSVDAHTQEPDSVLQSRYNDLGDAYLIKADQGKRFIDSAFYFLRKSIYLVDSSNKKNQRLTNRALELLATAYFYSGNIKRGQEIFNQVIASYRKVKDKQREADVWYDRGHLENHARSEASVIDSCFSRASKLYKEIGRIDQKISTDYNLATFHFVSGNAALAEREYVDFIKLARQHPGPNLPLFLVLAGQISRYTGNLQRGLSYALDAEQVVRETKDSMHAHQVFGELALQYEELNEPLKSIAWYDQCIKERVRINAQPFLIYRTASLMILQRLKIGQSREAFAIMLRLNKQVPPETAIDRALLAQCLAHCYNAMGQYQNAENKFLYMVSVLGGDVDGELKFIANFDVANFYTQQKQYIKARPYAQEAFRNLYTPGVSRVKDFYLIQFKIDSAEGRYVQAIDNFQRYKELNDSLFSVAKSKQIEELSIKYDVDLKERNLVLLQKDNDIQERGLRQAQLTRNLTFAGIALLLIILGLLYNKFQFKQKTNKKLEASQREIEKQNVALQRLVTEKEWLLKEIHHRVKNNLHTIVGLLDTQAGYLKNEEALLAIHDSQRRVQAMSIIHQKLFHSDSLSSIEMSGYIEELVGYLEHSFGIDQRIRFILDIEEVVLDLSYALPLSLILNEAITNSLKYAFPGNREGIMSIGLKSLGSSQYLLSISDNGVGLPSNFDIKNAKSMGMSLMKGLSEDIHGKFQINNNTGTEVQVLFDYQEANLDQFDTDYQTISYE